MILGIYGSGGLGRELAHVAEESNGNLRWNIIVFIDDINDAEYVNGYKVYRFDAFRKLAEEQPSEVVIGIGEPASREKLFDRISKAGLISANIVHPTSDFPSSCSLGKGSVLLNGARVSPNTVIGDNVVINFNCNIGHDCFVGNNSVVSTFVAMGGGSSVGRNTFIGMGSIIRDHISIGNNSIVSMGSHVFKNVPDNVTVFGSPARVMRTRDEGVFHNSPKS